MVQHVDRLALLLRTRALKESLTIEQVQALFRQAEDRGKRIRYGADIEELIGPALQAVATEELTEQKGPCEPKALFERLKKIVANEEEIVSKNVMVF